MTSTKQNNIISDIHVGTGNRDATSMGNKVKSDSLRNLPGTQSQLPKVESQSSCDQVQCHPRSPNQICNRTSAFPEYFIKDKEYKHNENKMYIVIPATIYNNALKMILYKECN